MGLGNCTQCGRPARFKFGNVAAYEIVMPDKTTKMIYKDHLFCDDHWLALIQELLAQTEYTTIRKTEEPPA